MAGLFRKSIETILKDLTKIHDDLRQHAEGHREDAARKTADAERLANEADGHHGEARRAEQIADNIGRLIGR